MGLSPAAARCSGGSHRARSRSVVPPTTSRRRRRRLTSWGLTSHGGHGPEPGRGSLFRLFRRLSQGTEPLSRPVRTPRAAATDRCSSSECGIRRPPPAPAERHCSITPSAAGKLGSNGSCWPTSGDRERGANDGPLTYANDAHSLTYYGEKRIKAPSLDMNNTEQISLKVGALPHSTLPILVRERQECGHANTYE